MAAMMMMFLMADMLIVGVGNGSFVSESVLES